MNYIILILSLIIITLLLLNNKKLKQEKLNLESEYRKLNRKYDFKQKLRKIYRKPNTNITEIKLIEKHLLNRIRKYELPKQKYSNDEILHYLNNVLIVSIRHMDSLIEKNSNEYTNQDHQKWIELNKEWVNELEIEKESLNSKCRKLIEMVLSYNNDYIKVAYYIFDNKISSMINYLGQYQVVYLNYTGNLNNELKYLKETIQNN